MEILRTISFYAESKGMSFLIIGGHAVNSYGILRHTSDIDLIVSIESRSSWQDLMEKLNYEAGQNDHRFARFRSRTISNWPIDLMYVDAETFSKLKAESRKMTFGEAEVGVISPKHLAILKIHALKHFQEYRYSKDFSDLEALLRSGQTGISDTELKELCERYADIELYNKLKIK